MLEIQDIDKLAKLSRIELSDAEKEQLLKDVDPILGYVAQIKEAVSAVGEEKIAGEHRNITRPDADPFESGKNTKAILDDMPETEGNYLKVKKIL